MRQRNFWPGDGGSRPRGQVSFWHRGISHDGSCLVSLSVQLAVALPSNLSGNAQTEPDAVAPSPSSDSCRCTEVHTRSSFTPRANQTAEERTTRSTGRKAHR